jgi:carbamoyltransferase
MTKILGISAFYHDSAAALVIDGKIAAAAQEERFTRIKHTPDFPTHAIKYCLEYSGLDIDELDAVIFYDKPFLKFERLLETYYAFAPRGLRSFLQAMPVWLSKKIFLKKIIKDELTAIQKYNKKKLKVLFSEHHMSHAASAFFPSPFKSSSILTIDGVGEWSTATIGYGEDSKITMLKSLNFPHSVGLLYSAFTYFLGFTVNSGEYKLMGLAPYGNPLSSETLIFVSSIKKYLVTIHDDGSIWLNQKYFTYATGLRMIDDKQWESIFGFPRREPESEMTQQQCNLALAIQIVTEEIVLKMAEEARRITGSENLCMAGGVALNCVANGKLLETKKFKNLYIQPASGDAGGALGAALTAYYMYFEEKRFPRAGEDFMEGAYLGPGFDDKEIERMCKKVKANFKKFEDSDELLKKVASLLSDGNVVGWFQGRMEFGPRALGNRSILADARNPEMQKKLNLKIKYREAFRPFAASVLDEAREEFFNLETDSPYMLLVSLVHKNRRKQLPENYYDLSMRERLYQPRSDVQSITHLDFSCRIQTVDKKTNLKYWQLIDQFKSLTGYGLVVNTSFNVRGEPPVCTPFEAYRCFMCTDMDYLVVENYFFCKTDQIDWENKEKWLTNFSKD